MEDKGFIYLIESKKNHRRYLGSTVNPNNRIIEHNNGKVSATRNGIPWKFCLIINVGTIKEARKIEHYIKRQKFKLSVENIIKALYWYLNKGL